MLCGHGYFRKMGKAQIPVAFLRNEMKKAELRMTEVRVESSKYAWKKVCDLAKKVLKK